MARLEGPKAATATTPPKAPLPSLEATVAASPAPGASPVPTAAGAPTRRPVPLPSLKPGEVITWVKLDRPRFAIGEIIVGSFAIAGAVALAAIVIGLVIGQWRSRHRGAQGEGGLRLR